MLRARGAVSRPASRVAESVRRLKMFAVTEGEREGFNMIKKVPKATFHEGYETWLVTEAKTILKECMGSRALLELEEEMVSSVKKVPKVKKGPPVEVVQENKGFMRP
ncbi:hypothetical protein PUNSTDRAFT_47252 [Punctularia strigosozonata HHB-11173 SS5]|uniref:Uncharacterized protein n=1 Tax=Punctularia strigosozonata (strain HHB-11173) TaxID=741275 RepID=R7S5T5_PUNST|nr:uncharacterized protein PUNSTDRAFT_47252 [Punctularia strigosozonata HHB-11173 SS5]EIN05026.1 hypothetical protein PUNSTDRAFT_47252 [Punctularia strigosozonata HHB-11173 SS5]